MEQGSWIRRNLALLAGITLPLVVIGFFLLATAIPRWLVAPPSHDLLVADITGYPIDASQTVFRRFTVEDGRLVAHWRRLGDDERLRPQRLLVLPRGGTRLREIELAPPPGIEESDEELSRPVAALADVSLLTRRIAPDGYEFTEMDRGGIGLFNGLFGIRRYRSGYAIEKQGRTIPLRFAAERDAPWYSELEFLGWLPADAATP